MTGLKLRTGGMSRSSSMTAGSLKPGREENGCGGFLFVRGPEAFGPFPAAACEDWKRPDLLPGGANWIAIAIPRRAATVCAASVPVGRPTLPPKAGSRTHRREHEVRPVWPDSLGGWGDWLSGGVVAATQAAGVFRDPDYCRGSGMRLMRRAAY